MPIILGVRNALPEITEGTSSSPAIAGDSALYAISGEVIHLKLQEVSVLHLQLQEEEVYHLQLQ